jgi:hypothetical protein
MSRSLRACLVVIVVLLACSIAACSSDGPNRVESTPDADAGSQTVVAVGGNDTQGDNVPDRLHEAWPYRMFRDAFPRSTVFVNASVAGATAAAAERGQLPIVRELAPDVVVIWIGTEDMVLRTPTRDFARALSRLIAGAQDAGAARVLVGNLPDAYGARARPYNTAIQHAVRETGAELVELDREPISLADELGPLPQLDVDGHRRVAEAFGRRIAAGARR